MKFDEEKKNANRSDMFRCIIGNSILYGGFSSGAAGWKYGGGRYENGKRFVWEQRPGSDSSMV